MFRLVVYLLGLSRCALLFPFALALNYVYGFSQFKYANSKPSLMFKLNIQMPASDTACIYYVYALLA